MLTPIFKQVKLCGVIFDETFKFDEHFSAI